MEKSTFVIDVDHTICVAEKYPDSSSYDYANAKPIMPVIDRIRQLKTAGHTIILHTARGMRTHSGNVKKITEHVLPTLVEWLDNHGVPYDEIQVGKPWGPNVYYVDDKALSPADFAFILPESYQTFINESIINP